MGGFEPLECILSLHDILPWIFRETHPSERLAVSTKSRNSLTISRSIGSGSAPTCRGARFPPEMNNTGGGPCTGYCIAHCWCSSVLTLLTSSRPVYSLASFSRVGATIRHGPHQGAQKSTITGIGDFRTVSPKA